MCSADLPPLRCPCLGSKGRLSTHPPALPVGKGAGRCAPWSPPEVFPLGAFWVCVGPVSVALSWSGLQEACIYPSPRPSRGEGSWSLRSDVTTGGCCFRAFCFRASASCCVVFPAGGMPVGGRAPCRSVRRFPAFRPRTPCFSNPLWSVRNDMTMCFRSF